MFSIIKYFFGSKEDRNFSEIALPLLTVIGWSILLLYCVYATYRVNVYQKGEIAYKREITQLESISKEKEKEIATLNIIKREQDEVIQNLTRMSQDIMRSNKRYENIVKETDQAVSQILTNYDVKEEEGTHGTKWEDDISLIRMDALWKGYCLNNPKDLECKNKGY